jgi:hypothetical protein
MPQSTLVVAIVSSAIAALSLILNAYLAFLLRNRRTDVSRNDDIRTRLYNLKHKLDETSLIAVTPHYELWEFGFKSLEELREVAVRRSGLLEIAPDGRIPRELKNAVKQIVDDIKGLYAFRDSYTKFAKGETITSQERLRQWKDFERAKNALSVLPADCRTNIPIIDAHLTRLY